MKYTRHTDRSGKNSSEDLNILGGKQLKDGAGQTTPPGQPASFRAQKKYSHLNVRNSKQDLSSTRKAKEISEEVVKDGPSLRQKSKNRTYAAAEQKTAAKRRSGTSRNYFLDEEKYYADNDALDQETFRFEDYDLNDGLSGIGDSAVNRLFSGKSGVSDSRTSQRVSDHNDIDDNPGASSDHDPYYDDGDVLDEEDRRQVKKKAAPSPGGKQRAFADRSGNRRGTVSGNGNLRKKTLKKDIFAIVLLALQGLLSIALVIVLTFLNVLPAGFFILLIVVLIVFWLLVFFSQFRRYRKLPLIGKIFSILLCIVLAVGNYYVIITNKAIDTVSGEVAYDIDYFDVVVLAGDPAQTIQDAADYTFGTQATFQPINLNTALNEIQDATGKTPETKDYGSALNEVAALYSGEAEAVIYNRDFLAAIEEKNENYADETRVIMTITIREKIDIKSDSSVDVTTQPFLFYISGNDEYGDISISGRSDVNMLIAVNPVSRQVLMINTPRDYYVELPGVSGGMRDKLTHAGAYGVQCQIDTMNELYGYDVDYYCKVNFSSLLDIINALGGIDLYNPYEFRFSYSDTVFPEGEIHLDAWTALEYCRERESLEDGDNERGRHQQMVIEAIINKLLSSAGFTAYAQLIKTLEKCCITNMPKESISALVKKQLAEGGSWNIVKASAEGGGMIQSTFSMGEMGLYVSMPYAQSIRNVQTMLRALYNGEEPVAIQMQDGDDTSYVAEPGPVPDVSEETTEAETTTAADNTGNPPDDGGILAGDDAGGGENGETGEDTGDPGGGNGGEGEDPGGEGNAGEETNTDG